jgi:ELWxxDGT repeat protein
MLVSDANGVRSLWWTDGTQAGTYHATTLPPSSARLASNGRLVFFVSTGVAIEPSLWVSDGTAEGTRALFGSDDPLHQEQPALLGVFDGVLLFGARTVAEGVELWRSDGTEEGTFGLGDLMPDPGSSNPSDAVALGDRVHFAATSPDVGRELFHVPRSVLARTCTSDSTTECLGQRFEVSVDWLAPNTGEHGRATVVPATDDTAMFWFFDENNLELAVKSLDGRAISGHHWLYYGALSDVAYWVTATDVDTGRTITYRNPAGTLCGHGDVLAFPDTEVAAGAESGELRAGGATPGSRTPRLETTDPPSSCPDGAACLHEGRFAVGVVFWPPAVPDTVQPGQLLLGTDDTAAFWFFDPANLEVLVKVLDARAINGRFWVYWGALSDVQYDVTVVDTHTGVVRSYRNPPGTLCGGADIEAF